MAPDGWWLANCFFGAPTPVSFLSTAAALCFCPGEEVLETGHLTSPRLIVFFLRPELETPLARPLHVKIHLPSFAWTAILRDGTAVFLFAPTSWFVVPSTSQLGTSSPA
jgi:hypothetical protein